MKRTAHNPSVLSKGDPVHAWAVDRVVAHLTTDTHHGLSEEEANRRMQRYGANALVMKAGVGALHKLLMQFHQPLLYILMGAAILAFFLGEHVDALVIFAVVVLNALIGFVQEFRAEKAIEALARMVPSECTVIRGGHPRRMDASRLVPGDVVLLESGDKVPGDLRLVDAKNLQIDESALTGESVPVAKNSGQLAEEAVLADRVNCAFSGTLVTHGRGRGVVFATGNTTETGKIARLVQNVADLSTPLTLKIERFSKVLLWVILFLSGVLFAMGALQGRAPLEMFMAAIALAVGAIPEGLPAAVTITLAIGVARMARRRAIIRKLPAVETLGSTTVICSDKTGTLTENQMTVVRVYAGAGIYEISGSGYHAEGAILSAEGESAHNEALQECLLAGLLCNDAHIRRNESVVEIVGDPTEVALLVAAEKAGFQRAEQQGRHPRLDHIPFESENQYMATLHQRSNGTTDSQVIFKKGSLERILSRCISALDAQGTECALDRDRIHRVAGEFAQQGLRVLAFARLLPDQAQQSLKPHHVETNLVFLGLQAMIDPPRPEAIQAVKRCLNAGIQVKMITGDHPQTALAIARQLGIAGLQSDALTGGDLQVLADPELLEKVECVSVFARVAPEQKLRLVKLLQERNHIVAMTGDGVNDAPSLRQANIGIAMGRGGTEVAQSAADMILTDDNFASIEAAVEEGRGVFDNLKKFILWTIPTNVGVAMVLILSVLLNLELPMLPVQLLWLNLATAVFLGLALVFEPTEPDIMQRPPRDPSSGFLDWPVMARSGLVSLMILLGAGLAYFVTLDRFGDIAVARTAVINTVICICAFYLLSCRSLTRSAFASGVTNNGWIWLGLFLTGWVQWLFSQNCWMNRVFHTAPLPGEIWIGILSLGFFSLLVVEIEKGIRFSWRICRRRQANA